MFASLVMLSRSRFSKELALYAGLVTATFAGAIGAQTPTVAAGEPARFLQKYIGLSAGEIETAKKGAVVTKVLPTTTNDEVAIFGIVAVDAAREDVVKRVRDFQSFLKTPERSAFGVFSTPAVIADVAGFTADQSDLDAIKGCKPGDCDVKMPVSNIEEFSKTITWSQPATARAQVEKTVREHTVGYVNSYRKLGTAGMLEYGDQKVAGKSGDVFTTLLSESPYVFDYVAPFHKYLVTYPQTPLADVTDAIYWANDKMGSMRPIYSINHLSVYANPASALTLISNKQLYASHYFLGAFTLTTLLDRPEAASGKGIYYIVIERFRFDHLPSGGLLNIRGRVIGKLHDGLKADLAQRKATLEKRS